MKENKELKMKTIIKGKIVTNKLSLDDGIETVTNADGVDERRYVRKPEFNVKKETEYEQIGEAVEGYSDMVKNEMSTAYRWGLTHTNTIRLNEDTNVEVENEYYQHDIQSNVIIVDHVIEEKTEYVYGTEDELIEHLKDYKLQYVEDREELSTYVKVHNIDLETVDLDDLIKVVRGDEKTETLTIPYWTGDHHVTRDVTGLTKLRTETLAIPYLSNQYSAIDDLSFAELKF